MDNFSTPVGEWIVKQVEHAWEKNRQGILLAQIGEVMAVNREVANVEMKGKKLKDYIVEDLADKIRCVSHPQNRLAVIAISKDAPVLDDCSIYFPKANAKNKAVRKSSYPNAIIQAFIRPLPAGMQRVIELDPIPRFIDQPEGTPIPENVHLLDRGLLVDGGDAQDKNSSAQILTNIERWRQKVDIKKEEIATKPKADANSGRSILELLFDSLTPDDAKRIEIPMDILTKLHTIKL